MWESVKSHEGEISIKGRVAFRKRVTRSFCCGSNHSVNKVLTKSSLEKELNFMFSPVSCSCDFLILTLTELKVFLVLDGESFLGSQTVGSLQVLGPSAVAEAQSLALPQLSQKPNSLPPRAGKVAASVLLLKYQLSFSLFMYYEE